MQIWHYNIKTKGLSLHRAILAAGLMWIAAGIAAADTQPTASSTPIQIVADRLITDNDARSAEFIGHVKVDQGGTTIKADRLKLTYKNEGAAGSGMNAESIDHIEAVGNVRIEMDDQVAESQRAVYTTAERKLVLFGPGAKVSNGPNVIEGSQITFYRETGRAEVLGDEKNPVKAIIRSDQRGLN
jgi:lipopolysaccharide export system protein LptA